MWFDWLPQLSHKTWFNGGSAVFYIFCPKKTLHYAKIRLLKVKTLLMKVNVFSFTKFQSGHFSILCTLIVHSFDLQIQLKQKIGNSRISFKNKHLNHYFNLYLYLTACFCVLLYVIIMCFISVQRNDRWKDRHNCWNASNADVQCVRYT